MATMDQSTLSLEISRHFEVPPERVFDAWLSKEWGEWLPPASARCEVKELEPRVGGTMRVGRRVHPFVERRRVHFLRATTGKAENQKQH